MSKSPSASQIVDVPMDRIHISNPRTRSRRVHREIVANIETTGLRRPITVSPRRSGSDADGFDLVCGQGRMEAYYLLGQDAIPAIVREATPEECMLKSLVENIARHKHRPYALLSEIASQRERGHSNREIAETVGMSVDWVRDILGLVDQGEERLLAAVDRGMMPMSLAVEISRAESKDVQRLLAQAYEKGTLRGRRVGVVRRALDLRARKGKTFTRIRDDVPRCKPLFRPGELRRIFEKEARKQAVYRMKAEFSHERLAFVAAALKDLLGQPAFVRLLRSEGCHKLPKVLADRIAGSAAP